jgi:hypothetical protein
MKISVEAKVAGAVALAFTALSIGAIAKEQGEHGRSGFSQTSPSESEISLSVQNAGGDNHLLAQY